MSTASGSIISMPVVPSPSRDKNETIGENYDRLYAESWEAALAHCESTLERTDHSRALQVKTADDFRAALRQLRIEHPDQSSGEIISMLFPVVEHYEVFANSFVTMMAHRVDVSMLWGLLYLVIQLSLETRGTIDRIHRMLRGISHKLEQLNEILTTVSDFTKFKAHVFEINREIFMLWLNVIMVFRTQDLDDDPAMVTELKEKFDSLCNTTEKQVESLVRHIQDMTLIAGRQPKMVDLSKFYGALSLQQEAKAITVPCHTIPVQRNLRFFGRQGMLQQIEAHFTSASALSGMASLAIYGLGGVGKSQIALEYAWKKQAELDVVLWIPAESPIAIQQALSHAATNALNLAGAEPTSHNKNAVLVMQWLRTTDANWLLVFDNVETPLVFETYWPVSDHGSILVTTRKLGLTTQPITARIEINEFNPEQGAQFLIHNLPGREISKGSPEFEAALAISCRLSGHALAINQMTALIIAKGLSLEKFLVMYDKHSKKMHRERKSGWKYPGYEHAIDTLWELSFSSLDRDTRVCLGILSFLEPDSIPQELFQGSPASLESPALQFCEDEYSQSEVFETLANLALIRINHNSETISVHRLVQSEFLFQMTANDRQEEFDATILLLLDRFPSRGESLVDEGNWAEAERYLPQVLVALQKFRDSQKEQDPLKPSLNLLNLICDTLWYLATNDSAGNRDVVLNTAYLAWDKWDSKEDAPLIHAYILARGSDQDLWNGEFNNGIHKIREALKIALKYLEPDNERVLQYNSDYGIAFGSAGDYERGGNYLGRAEEFIKDDPKRYGIAKAILINANTSRNSYCNGDYEDARQRLTRTMEMSKEMGSLYWQILIHFCFISLGLRSGDKSLANDHLVLADEAIGEFGRGRNIQLNGMYNYFAGRVKLDRGRAQESIEYFEKAIAIDDIQLTPRGYRARHLYALSRAQAALPGSETLSAKTQAEAVKLAGNIVLEGEGDHWDAFDMLIRIVER